MAQSYFHQKEAKVHFLSEERTVLGGCGKGRAELDDPLQEPLPTYTAKAAIPGALTRSE